MKNKKGFTLVELLAVIIILGLIIAIAVPSVNKYLKTSKEKAYNLQISNMLKEVESYANINKDVLPKTNGKEIRITLGQLKAEGLVKEDIVDPREDKKFDDSIEFVIKKNGNSYSYSVDEATVKTRSKNNNAPKIILSGSIVEYYHVGDLYEEKGYSATDSYGEVIEEVTVSEELTMLSNPGTYKLTYTAVDKNGNSTTVIRNIIVIKNKYEDGDVIYFNPVTASKCDSNTAVSTTGTKTGCMKWYTFLDDENSDTVNLLLDHNTTGYVAWNINKNAATPDTVNAQLQRDIINWNSDIKETARLISAEEVNKIAPTSQGYSWNQKDFSTWYSFHNGNRTIYNGPVGSNLYAWLFDNTLGCTTYGCNIESTGTQGYWTSSYIPGGMAWDVRTGGFMARVEIDNNQTNGVRPVISVNKNNL